jgi:hypothetical protein
VSKLSKYRIGSKYALAIILVQLLATFCTHDNPEINNDLMEWKLQGPIKTISEIDYSNTGKYTTYLSFDANGLIQEQSSFNHDGSLIRKWKYEYNNRNQKIARFTYVLNDSLSEILHYSYLKNNKLADEKLLNPQGSLISLVKHEYDSVQNEIARRFFDGNAKIQGGILYTYDDKKNITEEFHYDSVFHQNVKQRKKYTTEGLNSEILYLSMNDSVLRRITNVFLPNRQIGETCIYFAGVELVSKTTYEYDKNLNVTRKLIYSTEDKTTQDHTFKYTFDKYKNWTSRNEFVNDVPVDMITRKIDYY